MSDKRTENSDRRSDDRRSDERRVMVVDVSDLLQRYVGIFEMLENLMTNIESTFEFNEDDFRYIRDLTEKSIQDIHSKLNKQVDSMAVVFEKEGLTKQAVEIRKLKETSAEISSNASNITKTTKFTKSNSKSANTKSGNTKTVNAKIINAKTGNVKAVYAKKNNAANKNTKSKTLRQKFSDILYD